MTPQRKFGGWRTGSSWRQQATLAFPGNVYRVTDAGENNQHAIDAGNHDVRGQDRAAYPRDDNDADQQEMNETVHFDLLRHLFVAEKFAALLASDSAPRCMRFLWRGVYADVLHAPIGYAPVGTKAVAGPHNTSWQISAVTRFLVPQILSVVRLAEIAPSIVRRIAVLMVDFLRRQRVGLHDPDQAMRLEPNEVYDNADVPPFVGSARDSSLITSVPAALRTVVFKVMRWPSFPGQRASLSIVHKAFAQIVCSRQPLAHFSIFSAQRSAQQP